MKTVRSFFFLLTILLPDVSSAQNMVIREQTGPTAFYFEAHALQRDSSGDIFLPFRIRYDFFVFTRINPPGPAEFGARGEVLVELIDTTGTSVARTFRSIELTSSDNSPSHLRSLFAEEFVVLPVSSGRYTVVITAEDKESKRIFRDQRTTISYPSPHGDGSTMIPVEPTAGNGYRVANLGGDVHFSQPFGILFLSSKKHPTIQYSLKKILPDDETETIDSERAITPTIIEQSTVHPAAELNAVRLDAAPHSSLHLHHLSFNRQDLRQGRYELELVLPDSSRRLIRFGARWLNMPNTLADLDLATEPLQFIMTKADYSELRRGGRETRIKKFDEFWKKKDPSPATAYNEVMHEFYRRADYALINFRTLRDANGAITDRGKVYILYGKPSSTERSLSPGGAPREVWTYDSLNKKFTFEDPGKQGNYKLAENK